MKKRLLALLVLALVMVLALASCGDPLGDWLNQVNPPVEENEYVVYFITGEGAYVPTQTVTEGGLATRPENPTREGYDFVNWYADAECTSLWSFDTDKITHNTMIYAKWVPHVHVGGSATCEKGPICTSCNKEYGEPLGHKGGSATCEDEAICEVCGKEYGNALGHTVVVDEAVAPTCTETGLTAGSHCSECGEVLEAQEVVPATGHTPVVDEAVAPTCTETGLTEGSHCSVCEEVLEAQEVVPATGHTFGEWIVDVEPTIDTEGSKHRECACGEIETGTIPALSHTHSYTSEVTTAPTCTENGVKTFTCSCGDTYTEVVPALEHDYDVVVTDPTCTEGGYTTYTCAFCDYSYTADETDPLGHKDEDGDYKCDNECSKVVEPADGTALTFEQAKALANLFAHNTYTTNKYYVTGIISEVYNTQYGNIKFEGTDFVVYGLYSADGNTGYNAMSYKPVAGDEITVYGVIGKYNTTLQMKNGWLDEVVAHEHDWSEATCKDPARCTICGTTTGDVTDHVYVDGVCKHCGHEEGAVITEVVFDFGANGDATHVDGNTLGASKSYTANGYTLELTNMDKVYGPSYDAKGNSCIKLGTSSAAATLKFTVPDDVTSVVIYIAKYKANTSKIKVNGVEYTLTKNSNDGAYDEITVDTSVEKTVTLTTVSGGVRAMVNSIKFVLGTVEEECEHVDENNDHLCDECEEVVSECVEGTPVVENNVDPDCVNNGSYDTVVYCTVCGEEISRETTTVDALGHDYETVVTAPDCVNNGYTTYTCHCGHSYVADETDALGHAWGEWIVDTEATEETDGLKHHICDTCGERKEVVIPSLQHEHRYDAVVTDPTCTAQGYTTHTCRCNDSYVDSYVPALGHTDGDAVVENNVPATCTVDGSYDTVVYCTVCETEVSRETVTVDAIGHNHEASVTAPTCTAAGYTTYVCSNCDDTYTADEVSATGHKDENADYKCDTCSTLLLPEADSALTLAQASALAKAMGDTYTTQKYYITGIITEVYNTTYGNLYIKDNATEKFTVYGLYTWDKAVRYDAMTYKPVKGDEITVYGVLGCYKGTPQMKDAWLDEVVAHEHNWGEATCDKPTTCSICGGKNEVPHTRSENELTCSTPIVCTECEKVLEAVDHVDENENGKCDLCKATLEAATENQEIVFDLGEKGTNTDHVDNNTAKTTYSETVGEYTLSITNGTNMYPGSFDPKANSCIKLGTSSKIGSFAFTVPDDVTSVVIYIAKYKANTAKINVNGIEHTLTKNSNDGQYDKITVNTSAEKTVTLTTVSGGVRAMVNSIVFVVPGTTEVTHEHNVATKEENRIDPTCTAAGSYDTVTYCSDEDCGEELFRVTTTMDALGHTEGEAVVENSVAADCVNNGSYDTVVYCTVCGEEISRETTTVDALGHDYETVVTAPDCVNNGYTTYTCHCGHSYVADETDALGHAWGEWIVDTEATEETDGLKHHICDTCGERKEVVIPSLQHEHRYDAVVTDPTCTAQGYTTHTCRCNDSYVDSYVPALGHTDGDAVVENSVAADCVNNGSYDTVVYCSVCGEELSRETTTVDALGHTEGEAVVENNVDPDCVNTGKYDSVVYCSVCDVELSRVTTEVPVTDHDYEASVTAPTCTAAGYTTYTCSNCGDTKKGDEVPATGHKDENADYKCDTCSTLLLPEADSALTLAQASALAKAMGDTYTTQKYYITGIITEVYNTTYGNLYIKDNATEKFTVYGLYTWDKAVRYDAMTYKPVKGDEITVYGVLGCYKGTPQMKDAWLDEVVAHEHNWGEATCDKPTTCSICGGKNEVPHTRSENELTCSTPIVCTECEKVLEAVDHVDENENGKCDLCKATLEAATEEQKIVFDFGANGTNTEHVDGNDLGTSKSYTVDGYTLNLTGMTKVYGPAYDVKHNSCIKLGTSKLVGGFSFTVPEDVVSVVINVAKYKANNTVIEINGTKYTLTKNSNDGQYDAITIDTSVTKTVKLTTVASTYRAMVNSIVFVVPGTAGVAHEHNVATREENRVEPTCTAAGSYEKVTYCADEDCGEVLDREPIALDSVGHADKKPVDHKCDTCGETLSQCADVNPVDHECDVCGLALTRCEDGEIKNHVCEICGDEVSDCADENKDHNCDVCGTVLSECETDYRTHNCEYCGKKLTECVDNDKDHECDVCGLAISECVDSNRNHKCDICDDKMSDCADDDRNHYCDWCGIQNSQCMNINPTEDHNCDWCGKENITECVGSAPVVENKVDPTCTAEGSYDNVVYCTVCGEELSRETVKTDKLAHNMSEFVTTIDPTCEGKGEERSDCSNCDHFVTNELDALGHTPVVDKAVASTCTATGLTEGSHCDVCNEVLVAQTVVPALGHSYDFVVTDPTCTEGGYTTYTCSVCDHSYVADETDALNHDMVVDPAKAPTCTETGLTEGSHCSRCDHKVAQEVVPATGHTKGNVVVENNVPATCTVDGSYDNVVYCSVCKVELSRETVTVKAPGHTPVVDKAVASTCTATGLTEGSHCDVCNEVLVAQTVVPALGHSYDFVVTDPTCTEGGYTTYTCSVCDHSYVADETDALNHDMVVDPAKAPTCTETGLEEGSHCSRCDYKVAQKVVPANGHKDTDKNNICEVCKEVLCGEGNHVENEGTVTKDPTCTEAGEKTFTCTACGDTVRVEALDKLGHNMIVDEAVAPTCTATGLTEGSHCSRCDHKVAQEVVPATGHKYSSVVVTAPTCTDGGYTTYTCSACNHSYVADETEATDHAWGEFAHQVVDGTIKNVSVCGNNAEHKQIEDVPTSEIIYVGDEAFLAAALTNGYSVVLTADIDLTENLHLTNAMNVVIDLAGKTIDAAWDDENGVVDVLWADGAGVVVTIKGNGTMTCTGNGNSTCVVSATDGAKVTIVNGTFASNGSACIYATRGGAIEILDGEFSADETYHGNRYLLDVNEAEKLGTITVYGGTFHDFDPANHTNDGASYTNKVAEGYHSIKDGNVYEVGKHEYDVVVTDPNCVDKGYTTHTCVCGDSYVTDETAALGHTKGEVVVENNVAPDCVNAGSYDNVVYCTVCEKEVSRETVTVNALNHIDENDDNICDRENCEFILCTDEDHISDGGVVTTSATCVATGVRTYSCSACGKELRTEEIPVDPNAHNIVKMPAKDKTCTEDGHSVYDACTLCDYEDGKNVIKASGHFFKIDVVAKSATCTEDGYTATERCFVCDYTKGNEVIPATGHTEETVPGKAATCTETGLTEGKKCSACGVTTVEQETIPATGHTEETVPGKVATCAETGLTEGKKCSVCGVTTVEQKVIEKIAHTEETISGKAATCTETGLTEGKKCSVCGVTTVEQKVIEKIDHSYEEDVTAPTCTAGGYTTYTCVCGYSYVEDYTEMIPHTKGDVVVENEAKATCTVDGSYDNVIYCTVCKNVLSRETVTVDALGHDEVEHEGRDATCTENGYEAYVTCSRCDYTTYEEIKANGHKHTGTSVICDNCGLEKQGGWILVANTSQLTVGSEVVIVASGSNYAMSTTQNGNNRGQATITKSSDKSSVTFGSDVQIFTLKTGKTAGTFAFYTGSGYIYAASSGSNYLRTETTLSDNSSWTITVTSAGVATVKSAGSYERNWLRHNSNNSIFSCYGSGQNDISLYVMTEKYVEHVHTEKTLTGNAATCTENGLTEGKQCTVCGEVTVAQTEIPATGHNYVIDKAVAPTCQTTGLTEGRHCENNCGIDTVAQVEVPVIECNFVNGVCTMCGVAESHVCTPAEAVKENNEDPTCTEKGGYDMVVYCEGCGDKLSTEHYEVEATGHNYADGKCTKCGEADPDAPVIREITFTLGADGSASHADGSSKTTYSETVEGYTLNITSGSSMYTGARDAKGNSCIKFGTSSKTGSMKFTVADNVNEVVIYVGKYKTNTSKVTINGTTYTLSGASNNGAYDAIVIDTSTNKTVEFTTASGGVRAMLNTIVFKVTE